MHTLPAIAAKGDIGLVKAIKASVVGYKAYALHQNAKGGHVADGGQLPILRNPGKNSW